MAVGNIVAVVQAALQRLDAFLGQYGSGRLAPGQAVPDLGPIMQAVDSVGKALEESPKAIQVDPATQVAVDEYVAKLKRLETVLEDLKPQLESRRDELRARLGKVRASLRWADSFNQTR